MHNAHISIYSKGYPEPKIQFLTLALKISDIPTTNQSQIWYGEFNKCVFKVKSYEITK